MVRRSAAVATDPHPIVLVTTPHREERRRRLHDVLARQQRMGLAKAAGTQELYFAVARGGGRGGGRGVGRGAGEEEQQ